MDSNFNKIQQIEDLLEGVMEDLNNLSEENFERNFKAAKSKMELVKKEKAKYFTKFNSFVASKKIVQLAKLIPEKYDNVIKDWTERLNLVQKEIELTRNQKKITIYSR